MYDFSFTPISKPRLSFPTKALPKTPSPNTVRVLTVQPLFVELQIRLEKHYAQASLTVEEARLLAAELNRYADAQDISKR